MNDIYDEEALDELEQEEHSVVDEFLLLLFGLMLGVRSHLENELRTFYQKYGKNNVVTYQQARKHVSTNDHRKRLNVLLLLISAYFDDAKSTLTPHFKSALTQGIKKELGFFDVDLDIEDILNTPWGVDDATWLTRLENDVDLWSTTISTDVKRALHRHDDLETVLSQLDKRFTSIEKVLKKLLSTEVTAVDSIARRQIFKELGVTKYKFYAREDERTCDICGSLHGLIFPVSAYEIGVTASPIHSHCRCWEVPIKE